MAEETYRFAVTSTLEALFEDFLSSNQREYVAIEPESHGSDGAWDKHLPKEVVEHAGDGQDPKLPKLVFTHVQTGHEIPYPPGTESARLTELRFDYSENVGPTVVLANRVAVTSTAEIAANSPRYRRRSSTFIDGVHDIPDENPSHMAPAQLYSTMSGRLFHSGRIAIVLVGLPARGKT
jgi:hypothetical protein